MIEPKSYATSQWMCMVAVAICIIIVPLQLFCQGYVKAKEANLIGPFQKKMDANFPSCTTKGDFCNDLITWPTYMFSMYNTQYALYWLAMFGDSLLAFKTTMVTVVGMYTLVVLQLTFRDGRPFWDQPEVNSNGQCLYTFGSPDTSAYNASFLWPYMIVMYLYKYNRTPYVVVNTTAITLLIIGWVWIYFESYVNGTSYIYQNVIGQFVGLVYLVFCLTFDDEIHRYCEKVGFIVKSSRSRKFHVFFFALACLIIVFGYYAALEEWTMPLYWIVNSTVNEEICLQEFQNRANNNLGMNATFCHSAILFVLIGANFGQSFTLNFLKPLHWSHTQLWKRLLRSVVGLALAIGVFKACVLLVSQTTDFATKYFFSFLMPDLLTSFFFFGIYPIVCQKIGLVISAEEFERRNPLVASKLRSSILTLSVISSSRQASPQAARFRKSPEASTNIGSDQDKTAEASSLPSAEQDINLVIKSQDNLKKE